MDDLKQIASSVARLEEAHQRERAASRRFVWITTIAAVALVAIVLGFAWKNYSFFRSEWTEAKLTKHMRTEVAELEPSVQRELGTLAERLGPVYSDEFRRQVPTKIPAISARLRDQFDRFGADFQADIHARLHRANGRVRSQLSDQLLAAYPSMRESVDRAELETRVSAVAKDAVAKSITQFQGRFAADLEGLRNSVDRFRGNAPDVSTLDLQKHFIRLWLQLLDEEIRQL